MAFRPLQDRVLIRRIEQEEKRAVLILEPDALEDKYYAPGVGNVLTVDLVTAERDELVSITTE